MHVVTDDERREAARRLRELHLDPWDDAACEIASCAGVACCNSECHGSDETPECAMALASHLADLIEPSCDRDALLELADEMEEDAMYWLNLPCDQFRSHDVLEYVRRIREALGVCRED